MSETPITLGDTTCKGFETALPLIVFDGFQVYQRLSERAKTRTSSDNVSDVLDAVVKILREQPDVEDRCENCGQNAIGYDPEGIPLCKRCVAALTSIETRTALKLAAALNTGQGCPDENHGVVVAAMDALAQIESLISSASSTPKVGGEKQNEVSSQPQVSGENKNPTSVSNVERVSEETKMPTCKCVEQGFPMEDCPWHGSKSQCAPSDDTKRLVQSLVDYIAFIDEELKETIGLAFAHGWKSTRYGEGLERRLEIKTMFETCGLPVPKWQFGASGNEGKRKSSDAAMKAGEQE